MAVCPSPTTRIFDDLDDLCLSSTTNLTQSLCTSPPPAKPTSPMVHLVSDTPGFVFVRTYSRVRAKSPVTCHLGSPCFSQIETSDESNVLRRPAPQPHTPRTARRGARKTLLVKSMPLAHSASTKYIATLQVLPSVHAHLFKNNENGTNGLPNTLTISHKQTNKQTLRHRTGDHPMADKDYRFQASSSNQIKSSQINLSQSRA